MADKLGALLGYFISLLIICALLCFVAYPFAVAYVCYKVLVGYSALVWWERVVLVLCVVDAVFKAGAISLKFLCGVIEGACSRA